MCEVVIICVALRTAHIIIMTSSNTLNTKYNNQTIKTAFVIAFACLLYINYIYLCLHPQSHILFVPVPSKQRMKEIIQLNERRAVALITQGPCYKYKVKSEEEKRLSKVLQMKHHSNTVFMRGDAGRKQRNKHQRMSRWQPWTRENALGGGWWVGR